MFLVYRDPWERRSPQATAFCSLRGTRRTIPRKIRPVSSFPPFPSSKIPPPSRRRLFRSAPVLPASFADQRREPPNHLRAALHPRVPVCHAALLPVSETFRFPPLADSLSAIAPSRQASTLLPFPRRDLHPHPQASPPGRPPEDPAPPLLRPAFYSASQES